MIKSLFLLLTFLIVSPAANAVPQNFLWVNNQYHNISFNPDLTIFLTCSDNSGNSCVSSIHNYKLSYNGYYGDYSLKKFNSAGQLIFNKILTGKIQVKGLESDNEGNLYVSGSFMDTLRIDNENFIPNTGSGLNVNYFLIKLNPSSGVVWKKNINTEYSQNYVLDAIKVKNDFLYLGIINIANGFIKKCNLNGNEILSIHQYPVRGISSIDADQSGNIYTAGSCEFGNINFGGHTVNTSFFYNMYFVKYSSTGKYAWSNIVEDITFQAPVIACDNSGNLYAAGDLNAAVLFGNILSQGRQWVYDFFITRINPSGNFVWLREVPHQTTITGDAGNAFYNSIAVDSQDNLYFTGFIRGTVNWGNGIISTSSGYRDILFQKYDTDGNLLWCKTAGGSGINRGDDISVNNLGEVFVTGSFSSTANFDTISVTGTGSLNSFITKISSGLLQGFIELSLIPEGFYVQSFDNLSMSDTIAVYLRYNLSPYNVMDSGKATIDSISFSGMFGFNNTVTGLYFIQTKHRNALETWSSSPVSYTTGDTIQYSFINSLSQAYGNNLVGLNASPVRFGLYSGDVNSDQVIDAADLSVIDNDAMNFAGGYILSDLTGDGITDAGDAAIAGNNAANFIGRITP